MVAKEFIVAIELGSSKMTGIAGKRNSDGSLQILALAQEDSSSYIRKGVVFNIDKTATGIENIINKLQNVLKMKISKVYVGIGGQSLHTVKNTIKRQLEKKTIISQELVDSIMDSNLATQYPDKEILHVVPQEYIVGGEKLIDPVGVLSDEVEGVFLNVVAKRMVRENIQKCCKLAGQEIVDIFIAPLALGDSVLVDQEKRSGCALVDFGAETTTVSIYKNNLLRHLVVIPLGGSNITKDICALQIDEDLAEKMKLQHGSAYSELTDEEKAQTYPIDNDRTVEAKVLSETIEAREEEIIANVANQIKQAGYETQLLAGIVFTGGGANIADLDKAFSQYTSFDKFKFVKSTQITIHALQPEIVAKDGRLNTVIGLLAMGNDNCCGGELGAVDLFTDKESIEDRRIRIAAEEEAKKAKEQEDKEKAAADAAKAAAEAAEREREEAQRKKEEEKAEKKRQKKERHEAWKKNNIFTKMGKGIKKLTNSILEEEE